MLGANLGLLLYGKISVMVQKRAARFVTGNYNYETGSMTGILGQLKWKSLKKRRKDNRLNCYIKVLKVKPVYQQMTLFPKLGVVEISTLWHFRLPLPIQMFIKVVFFPQTIRDWNALPDSLISSAEDAEDCVFKFIFLVRARD